MRVSHFIQLIEQMTYKPAYTLSATRDLHRDYVEFRVSGRVPDVREPAKTIAVTSRELFHTNVIKSLKPNQAYKLIRKAIYDFEHHEADEWLRVDGECLYDPHAHDGLF